MNFPPSAEVVPPSSSWVRKRANKACMGCRRRKVRCDVTRCGTPCTNCRLDEKHCAVVPRATKWSRTNEKPTSPVNEVGHVAAACTGTIEHVDTFPPPSPGTKGGQSETTRNEVAQIKSHKLDPVHIFNPALPFSIDQNASFHPAMPDHSWLHPVKEYSCAPESPWTHLSTPDLGPGDAKCLIDDECFKLPQTVILAEFMKAYFLHVHPLLPLFREGDFWAIGAPETSLNTPAGTQEMSLLLLQAMLFASSVFVPPDTVKSLGFSNIRQASHVFYRRAKTLYEYSNDSNHVLRAQAALLLTYWYPMLGSEMKAMNSTWLSIAIRHAKEAGAHEYDTKDFLTKKDQNVLKRLWWCCIIRDRVMPLCVRRAIQIGHDDFDFTTHSPLSGADVEEETKNSRVYNSEVKQSLILTLGLLTTLCIPLTDILAMVAPTSDFSTLNFEEISQKLVDVNRAREGLEDWRQNTRDILSNLMTTEVDCSIGGLLERPVALFSNLMLIYYNAARIALANYELRLAVTPLLRTSSASGMLCESRKALVGDSAQELSSAITAMAEQLGSMQKLDIVRWLPSSIVGCVAMPLALHILDARLSTSQRSLMSWSDVQTLTTKQHYLDVLMKTMRVCHSRFDGVDWVSTAINYFLECPYWDEALSCLPTADTPSPTSVSSSFDGGSLKNVSWNDGSTHQGSAFYTWTLDRNLLQCVRLAITIDLSLFLDRLPEEKDYPEVLMSLTSKRGDLVNTVFGSSSTNQAGMDARKDAFAGIRSIMPEISAVPTLDDVSGWFDNDRSLYFASEMGLGPVNMMG